MNSFLRYIIDYFKCEDERIDYKTQKEEIIRAARLIGIKVEASGSEEIDSSFLKRLNDQVIAAY